MSLHASTNMGTTKCFSFSHSHDSEICSVLTTTDGRNVIQGMWTRQKCALQHMHFGNKKHHKNTKWKQQHHQKVFFKKRNILVCFLLLFFFLMHGSPAAPFFFGCILPFFSAVEHGRF